MEDKADVSQGEEEIFSIVSIYGDDFAFLDDGGRRFTILLSKDRSASVSIALPDEYPLNEPPICTLIAPTIRGEARLEIDARIDAFIRSTFRQQCILYELIERARDLLLEIPVSIAEQAESGRQSEEMRREDFVDDCVASEIIHGEPFTERRSTFQAHLARVSSVKDVQAVLRELKRNRKIAEATHNVRNRHLSLQSSNQSINRQRD